MIIGNKSNGNEDDYKNNDNDNRYGDNYDDHDNDEYH